MANDALLNAKKQQNDEFYTLYEYIQKEVNAYLEFDQNAFKDKVVLCPCDDPEWSNFTKFFAQNFEVLGLKKLISTSYSLKCKKEKYERYHQMSLFEMNYPQYDVEKAETKGKIFTLTRRQNKSKIDYDDLEWKYLEGTGDFQSDEVKSLRDEADIIVTNPPFSLFRDFVAWILEANKKFLIIGQIGMATYKEIFPEIKNNRMWIGVTCNNEDMVFEVPEGANVNPKDREKAARMGYVGNYTRQGNACWFTNMDHGRRHQPLSLMTMNDNLKFSRHKDLVERGFYLHYDNFNAIDIPYIDAIPADYDGIMGVPSTYLDKYNPEQFEILGIGTGDSAKELGIQKNYRGRTDLAYTKNGVSSCPYGRILIRKRKGGNAE